MASTTKHQMKYDVFLSFRGADTRDNFTSHLHAALERRKIQTFIDGSLNRGEEITPTLLKSIEESKVSVIIFSQNYACSPWCLDELVKIMECRNMRGQIVLPIFYHVNPSDVEEQKGTFGIGFNRLREEYSLENDLDRVDRWCAALKEAAGIAGFDWRHHRPDHKLSEKVAELVLKELNSKFSSCSGSCHDGLVGIDSQIEQILTLLQLGSPQVLLLGIWGMGGIGKTRCARALVCKISKGFEGSFFLTNVTEEAGKSSLVYLRNQIIRGVLGEEDVTTNTPCILPDFILYRLRRKRVLICLDDVSTEEQLGTLADLDWYGPGSRIIVTSRDRQVLIQERYERYEIYEVKGLNDVDALQLFSWQAFKLSPPNQSCAELTKMVVNYAKGVPLALKVLGAFLYKKHPKEWKSKLEKLKMFPELQIDNVLRISYDGLDEDEQNIFLDIACFFKGEDRDLIENVLDGCGFHAGIGISRLCDKCLVTIVDNKLQMHDLLQEMGWAIVHKDSKEYGKHRRLWHADEILHALTNDMGTEFIEGMVLDLAKVFHKVHIDPLAFLRMRNLRILKFYAGGFWGSTNREFILEESAQSCNCLQDLPHNLRYLCWHGYPWESLPHGFSPQNLVALIIRDSKIERLWAGAKLIQQLKQLDLTSCYYLVSLPDLSSAINLEKIILDRCIKLREIPTSIQRLEKLNHLSLSDCSKLRGLPSLIHLDSLKTINLSGCTKFKKFPEIPANIKELYLDSTALVEWPETIQSLNNLDILTLRECKKLRSLPNALHLPSLKTFKLSLCRNIKRIPDILGNKLEILDLIGSKIKKLPSSIGRLSSLLTLDLRCTAITKLPESIGNLSSLLKLHLDFTSIKELPSSIGGLSSLVELRLAGTLVEGLPSSIGRLSSLVIMDLRFCKRLRTLPSSICELKCLKELAICRSSDFLELPSLSGLHSLTVLDLRYTGLHELPSSFGHLYALQRLYLRESNLQSIDTSIKQLSSLEKIDLYGCNRLKSLPELPCLVSDVDATNCKSLRKLSCSSINIVEKSWHEMVAPDYRFIFTNCINLDKSARANIMSFLRIDQDIETTLRKFSATSKYPGRPKCKVCLPESKIPDWFQRQSMGAEIHIPFSASFCKPSSIGLALAALVEFPDNYDNDGIFEIGCKCDLTNHNGGILPLRLIMDTAPLLPSFRKWRFETDHVFIWFVRDFRASNDTEEGCLRDLSFRFYASILPNDFKIKMCGVHIVYFENGDACISTSNNPSSSLDPGQLPHTLR